MPEVLKTLDGKTLQTTVFDFLDWKELEAYLLKNRFYSKAEQLDILLSNYLFDEIKETISDSSDDFLFFYFRKHHSCL